MTLGQFAEGAAKFSAGFDIISSSIGAYNAAKTRAAQYKAQAIGHQRDTIAGTKNLEGERVRNAVIRASMRRQQGRTQGTIGAMSSGRGGGDTSTIADLSLMTEQDADRDVYYQQLGSTLRQQAIDSQIQQAYAMGELAMNQSRTASKSAFGAALLTGVTKTIEYGTRIAAAVATGGASELARAGAAPQTKVGGADPKDTTAQIIAPNNNGANLGGSSDLSHLMIPFPTDNPGYTEVFGTPIPR